MGRKTPGPQQVAELERLNREWLACSRRAEVALRTIGRRGRSLETFLRADRKAAIIVRRMKELLAATPGARAPKTSAAGKKSARRKVR